MEKAAGCPRYSAASGTGTETSAKVSRLRIDALTIVSDASFSFGTTIRAPRRRAYASIQSIPSKMQIPSDCGSPAYAQSAIQGTPMTGRALGACFDRSERWGRARIAEARGAEVESLRGASAAPRSVSVVGGPVTDGGAAASVAGL